MTFAPRLTYIQEPPMSTTDRRIFLVKTRLIVHRQKHPTPALTRLIDQLSG